MRKIIALEGIDGSGKTVQFKLLQEHLIQMGYTVDCKEFPMYSSYFGKIIGQLLSGKAEVDANGLDPKSMALWFAMDRRAEFDRSDEQSDFLLLNRYVLSNAAYQSARYSEDSKKQVEMIDWVMDLEHNRLKLPEPDIYIFLNITKQQADTNVKSKGYRDYVGDGKDVYEASDNMQTGAVNAYLACAKRFKNVHIIECMRDNEFLTPEQIHGMVLEVLIQNNII